MERITATEQEWLLALKLLESGTVTDDVELHSADDEGQDINVGCIVVEL